MVIEDAFFASIPEGETYQNSKYIPQSIKKQSQAVATIEPLIILFGSDKLEWHNRENRRELVWGNDLFAATFFMLSRWEEVVYAGKKDAFDRMPESEMLAFKAGFYQRPIVNEYLDEWVYWAHAMVPDLPVRQQSFQIHPTHDIDYLKRYPNYPSWIKSSLGAFFRGYGISTSIQTLVEGWKVLRGSQQDPFQSFERLSKVNQQKGWKADYYFKMESDNADYQWEEDWVQAWVKRLQAQGDQIALHPNFGTYRNEKTYREEVERFQLKMKFIPKVRQHYLQYDLAITPSIQSKMGITIDSSLALSSHWGFRSGVCYDYPLFNFQENSISLISEEPVCWMDTAAFRANPDPDSFWESFLNAAQIVKRHRGHFRFIWHNNHFALPEWKRISAQYELQLNLIHQLQSSY